MPFYCPWWNDDELQGRGHGPNLIHFKESLDHANEISEMSL